LRSNLHRRCGHTHNCILQRSATFLVRIFYSFQFQGLQPDMVVKTLTLPHENFHVASSTDHDVTETISMASLFSKLVRWYSSLDPSHDHPDKSNCGLRKLRDWATEMSGVTFSDSNSTPVFC